MIKKSIEQKVLSARFCLELATLPVDVMKEFVDMCKSIYQVLFSSKKVKVIGCFSYDLMPYVLGDDIVGKHIVVDVHFMDYFMDFMYVLEQNDPNVFRAFFYKYLSEIECTKGNIVASAMYNAQYAEEGHLLGHTTKRNLGLAACATLFTFLHEAVHTDIDSDLSQSYVELYHEHAVKDLERFPILEKVDQEDVIKEGRSDFNALCMMLLTDIVTSAFQLSKQELYDICLTAVSAHFFYKILNGIIIEQITENNLDIDTITNLLCSRIITLTVFTLGMGGEDFVFHDIERKQTMKKVLDPYPQMVKWIGGLLQDNIIMSVKNFNSKADNDEIVRRHKERLEQLQKSKWIYVV